MTSSHPSLFPLSLTYIERYFLADHTESYPMTSVIVTELEGELQREAFEAAWGEARVRHPMVHAIAKYNGFTLWGHWEDAGALPPPITWYTISENVAETFDRGHSLHSGDSRSVDHAKAESQEPLNIISPMSLTPWGWIDIRKEPGVKAWVHQGGGRCRLTFLVHHACVDGVGILEFLGDLLTAYGLRTAKEGQPPPQYLREYDDQLLKNRQWFLVPRVRRDGLFPILKRLPWQICQGIGFVFRKTLALSGDRDLSKALLQTETAEIAQMTEMSKNAKVARTAHAASVAAMGSTKSGAVESKNDNESKHTTNVNEAADAKPPVSDLIEAVKISDVDAIRRLSEIPQLHFFEIEAAKIRKIDAQLDPSKFSLNDLMLRDLAIVLHEWNEKYPSTQPHGPLRIDMPMDLRIPDTRTLSATNCVSHTFLRPSPSLFDKPALLLEEMVRNTQNLVRSRAGMMFNSWIQTGLAVPGVVLMMTKIGKNYATTVLSNAGNAIRTFGAKFPMENGLAVAGNVRIRRITGVPPVRLGTPVVFCVTRNYRNLSMLVRTDPRIFSREAGEEITRMFETRLRQSIDAILAEKDV